MPSIAQIITNGNISVPLSANYNSAGTLFGAALATPKSPVLIQMVTNALDWMNSGGNYTAAELTSVANYDIWLMGRFGLQASSITGSGGSVSPITPSGMPTPYQFIVDATSSFILNGVSTTTISLFIGYNLFFSRNGIPQSNVTTESSYYTWDKTTGVFVTSPAAITGELFQIFAI